MRAQNSDPPIATAVVENHDDEPRQALVQGVEDGRVTAAQHIQLPPGEWEMVTLDLDGDSESADVRVSPVEGGEAFVQSDPQFATPEQIVHAAPFGGSVSPEFALTFFGLAAGVGNAAGQLLGASRVSGLSRDVELGEVAPAIAVSLAGAVAGALLLPSD